MRIGRIEQVIGPVVDVAFPVENGVPDIHHALVVTRQPVSEAMDLSDVDLSQSITLEVALDLGDGVVRTIAMESTDGLQRGLAASVFQYRFNRSYRHSSRNRTCRTSCYIHIREFIF